MTIDDELLIDLLKPDQYGNIGDDALVVKIVGTRRIDYKLEDSPGPTYVRTSGETKREFDRITPDIIVTIPREGSQIAIELENDISWNFQDSLRQVKKYKKMFPDTRIIIPEEYKRFAPLYKHEGFRTYLWKTVRRWQCTRCEQIDEKEGPNQPKCPKCKKYTEHSLIGLRDTEIRESIR